MGNVKKNDDKTIAPRAEPDKKADAMPAAGPHADARLTNPDATPGAGVMPDYGTPDKTHGDVDGGAG